MGESGIFIKNTASYGRVNYEQFVYMFFIAFIIFTQAMFFSNNFYLFKIIVFLNFYL